MFPIIKILLVATFLCGTTSLAFTLIPKITISNSPICAPNQIPPVDIPDDFLNCFEDVTEARANSHTDIDKTTEQIVTYYGYNFEAHNVTTNDGYILTVHRITGGPKSPPAEGKPSILVQHGMGGASDVWLTQYGDRNLAFKLADAGYDVWLGNSRGSSYSLGHEWLNAETDMAYWDFSWHEMGVGDLPAVVDEIIAESGNEKIYYAGWSQGTTEYFVGLSLIPELNDKIEKGFLMAPVAYMGHSNNPIRTLAPLSLTQAQYVLNPLVGGRFDEFKHLQQMTNISLGDFCEPKAVTCGVCDNFLYFSFGFNPEQQNYTNLPNIFSKIPNNISFKSIVHYSQSMNTCQFRQYDYGLLGNIRRYGSNLPPKYDLTRITTPTYMFHSDADNFAVPEDVIKTKDSMNPSVVKGIFRVADPRFTHMDFGIGKDADILVYDKILEILKSE